MRFLQYLQRHNINLLKGNKINKTQTQKTYFPVDEFVPFQAFAQKVKIIFCMFWGVLGYMFSVCYEMLHSH